MIGFTDWGQYVGTLLAAAVVGAVVVHRLGVRRDRRRVAQRRARIAEMVRERELAQRQGRLG